MTQKKICKKRKELSKKMKPFLIARAQLRLNCGHANRSCWGKSKVLFRCADCGKIVLSYKEDGPPDIYEEEFGIDQTILRCYGIKFEKRTLASQTIKAEWKSIKKQSAPIVDEIHRLEKVCQHPNMEYGGSGDGDRCPDCGIHYD